jgi:4-hydroxybenzoate polyprenyltransferase
MVAYSFYLKNIVILDVLTISGGFVLRAVAGAVVLGVSISPWLYVCTSLGALFIGFSKRYSELLLATNIGQRETLSNYSIKLLEQLIAIVAPSTLVSYIFYTFTAETLPGNHAMMLTIPFVMYGLFRYLTLVHHENLGEKPEEILLTDMPLLINIVLWLITASLILFLFR